MVEECEGGMREGGREGCREKRKYREGIVGETTQDDQMMPTIQGDTRIHSCTYVFEGLPKLCELVEALFDDA